MQQTSFHGVGHSGVMRRRTLVQRRTGSALRVALVIMGALMLSGFSLAQTRPPLQGGVEYHEGERPRQPQRGKAICEVYDDRIPSNAVPKLEPAAGRGQETYCPQRQPPGKPPWTLIGMDGNYCCYYEQSQQGPIPGGVIQEGPGPGRRPPQRPQRPIEVLPAPPSRWDGPLPWEQPARAQEPPRKVATIRGRMEWDEIVREPLVDRGRSVTLQVHRTGWCEFAYEFYADNRTVATRLAYHNEDRFQAYGFVSLGIIDNKINRPQPFQSNFRITPRGNRFDLTWISPTLETPEHWYKEYPERRGPRGEPYREEDTQRNQIMLWMAHCRGGVIRPNQNQIGPSYSSTSVISRLIKAPRSGSLTDPRGVILNVSPHGSSLQKQVPRARVEINWRFY